MKTPFTPSLPPKGSLSRIRFVDASNQKGRASYRDEKFVDQQAVTNPLKGFRRRGRIHLEEST